MIAAAHPSSNGLRAPRAVALGGGHGLQATLAALRSLTGDVTAVVTVADDGGSSGRLRRELGVLPPGDLRMAMLALAPADDPLWASVFAHRFSGEGALAGHAVGNLVLAGLLEVLGDPVRALAAAGELIGARGRVLPMCDEPTDIVADVVGLDADADLVRQIRGQVAVATTPGRVRRIQLCSSGASDLPPRACPAAVDAVLGADVVSLGPGSWFTSVLPHVLVPELHDALVRTRARKVLILNLVPQPGETAGYSPELYLDVLFEHAPQLRVDAVIADAGSVPTPQRLVRAAEALGARTYLCHVAAPNAPDRHDPRALADGLRRAMSSVTWCADDQRGRGTAPALARERTGGADGEESIGGDDG